MKALLLAAGYATRLYPLTIDKPKPLLPIGGKPVMQYIIDIIEPIAAIDEILVVTNHKFASHFDEWSGRCRSSKKITVIDDGTTTNEDRLGATGDIDFVIKKQAIKDDLLILAGDNIFMTPIDDFLSFSESKSPYISIGLYDVGDIELAKKYGIVSLDVDSRIAEFLEKPERPSSTLAAKCLYFFPEEKLKMVGEYLKTENSGDAPGYFLQWLCREEPVYGYVFKDERWFDIGDMASYEEANKIFSKKGGADARR